eukprot:1194361-Prorocentrum_minimum.AAC.3
MANRASEIQSDKRSLDPYSPYARRDITAKSSYIQVLLCSERELEPLYIDALVSASGFSSRLVARTAR